MDWLWATLFVICSFFNGRAALKLLLDWKGMVTTCRWVEDAYARLEALPDEASLDRAPAAPVFVHLVPAWEEPAIVGTLRALLGSRYPHGKLHVVVVTRQDEEQAPNPGMPAPTAELVRRLRAELPPYQQKMLSVIATPRAQRKADQLNWALRPAFLASLLNGAYDPRQTYVGVSDADSIPDPNIYRWVAADVMAGTGGAAYQGVTLSLANFGHLDHRARVCAMQQSSIFIRVSIARLINERRRLALFGALAARVPWLARLVRPLFELCFRRSQICLGHNQFVRLDVLQALGGFPTSGATEDSTLGYALGARGVVLTPLPLLELNDLPETPEKMVRQNARWYKGVLDDVGFLWRTWRAAPTAYNAAQLVRHVGNKVVEWPIATVVYPVAGFLGWHLAYRFSESALLFMLGVALPSMSLALTIWVGGIITQDLIEGLAPHFPRSVDVTRTSLRAKFWGIFRCQTYWLLATRGAWRVLWALARRGRFEPGKTDRVLKPGAALGLILLSGWLQAGCGVAVAQEGQRPSAAVGRVAVIDTHDSIIIAEFPEGRRLITIDMRELPHYAPGDEIRIDQAGRPLPRASR
jgi:Glycosyltransferase like family 2